MIASTGSRILFFSVAATLLVGPFASSHRLHDFTEAVAKDTTRPAASSVVSRTLPIYRDTGNTAASEQNLLGIIRYHYDVDRASCDNVLLLGVGTLMSVRDYDNISKKIASHNSIVVIVADHNVEHVEKTSPERYAMLTNEVINQLNRLLPICRSGVASYDEDTIQFLIGGHSASGQAALQAWQKGLLSTTSQHPVAFLGLDPYEISNRTIDQQMGLTLPSLSWGFKKSTCLVQTEKAARGAYETTKGSRVLYVIDNSGEGCTITHCVFTDRGCGVRPFSCTTMTTLEWVHEAVAESVGLFLQALHGASAFDHSQFELSRSLLPVDVAFFVNDENPNGLPGRVEEDSNRKRIVVSEQKN